MLKVWQRVSPNVWYVGAIAAYEPLDKSRFFVRLARYEEYARGEYRRTPRLRFRTAGAYTQIRDADFPGFASSHGVGSYVGRIEVEVVAGDNLLLCAAGGWDAKETPRQVAAVVPPGPCRVPIRRIRC